MAQRILVVDDSPLDRKLAGRLLEKMGKTAEARSHYEKLQKDFDAALGEFAGRAYKAEIERRLGQLGDAS